MSKTSIKQLKSEYDALLLYKRKIDPQNIIPLHIFSNFEEKYQKTAEKSDFLPKKLKNLQNELQALSIYLGHFSIFLGLYEQFLQREKMAKKDVAFYQAKNFIDVTLESFTNGNDVEIGLIQQIELLRNAISNLKKKPENTKKTIEKSENLPLFEEFRASKQEIYAFVAEKKLYKNGLSAAKSTKLKKAYNHLQLQHLQYTAKRKSYRYRFLVKYFGEALRSNDNEKMQVFLDRATKEIAKTYIVYPKNNAILTEKLVNISGKSEANTNVLLTINNKRKIKLAVDKNGDFHVEKLELHFGQNTIAYENESFGFLEKKPTILELQLNKNYLFLGRYDPLTQKAFEVSELNEIWRCKSCRNFSYNFSVQENEDRCIIKKCESKTFYTAEDAQFWVK